MMISRVSKVFV